jgi:hypothetical protein
MEYRVQGNRGGFKPLLVTGLVVAFTTSCVNSSLGNPKPEDYLGQDFIVVDGYVCPKTDEDWVIEATEAFDKAENEPVASILRSGEQSDWQDWDATELAVGTPIYKDATDAGTIYLAFLDNDPLRYFCLVEG